MTSPDATAPNQTRIAVWIVFAIVVPLILGALYGYTGDIQKIPALCQRVTTVEQEIPPMRDDLEAIRDSLQEIKTNQQWIMKQLGK